MNVTGEVVEGEEEETKVPVAAVEVVPVPMEREREEDETGVGRARGSVHGAAAEEDGSNALKTVGRAITATVMMGSTTYYPIGKSLPRALSVAHVAVFLAILLFLFILLLLLFLLRLSRPSGGGRSDDAGESGSSGGGCGGGGAVKFAERAAVAVTFLVPLVALPAGAYAVFNSKANSR